MNLLYTASNTQKLEFIVGSYLNYLIYKLFTTTSRYFHYWMTKFYKRVHINFNSILHCTVRHARLALLLLWFRSRPGEWVSLGSSMPKGKLWDRTLKWPRPVSCISFSIRCLVIYIFQGVESTVKLAKKLKTKYIRRFSNWNYQSCFC